MQNKSRYVELMTVNALKLILNNRDSDEKKYFLKWFTTILSWSVSSAVKVTAIFYLTLFDILLDFKFGLVIGLLMLYGLVVFSLRL
jgi:hypothetical protein